MRAQLVQPVTPDAVVAAGKETPGAAEIEYIVDQRGPQFAPVYETVIFPEAPDPLAGQVSLKVGGTGQHPRGAQQRQLLPLAVTGINHLVRYGA